MDQAVFHFINERWTNPVLDLFMAAISDVTIWKPLLIVLALYALIFCGFKGRAFVLCLALTLVISGHAGGAHAQEFDRAACVRNKPRPCGWCSCNRPRRNFSPFSRSRPFVIPMSAIATESGPSFPSGHVTDNIVIADVLHPLFSALGLALPLRRGGGGYSRIYLGAHWPSDVLATRFHGGW